MPPEKPAAAIVSSSTPPLAGPTGRTRITNGSELLPGVDGRTIWVRRLKDLIALHVADLGGEEVCSEAEKSIIRRASVITVELERMETGFALAGQGTIAELETYSRLSNTLRRLLDVAGLQRRSRDVTPTIDQYLREQGG